MNNRMLRLGLLFFVSFLYVFSSQTFGQMNNQLTGVQSDAETYFDNKEYKKVVDLLAPRLESLGRDDLLILGKSYSFLKANSSAVKIYQSLVSQDPKDYEALTLLGREYLVAGKNADALASLKDSLKINKKYRMTYSLLIQYYESQPKINRYELRLLYEDMVEQTGETEDAIISLCDLTANDRLYDLAAKYCKKGIAEYPKRPESYIALGQSYQSMGENEKALEMLKKVSSIFSKSDKAQHAYAVYLEEQKNFLLAYNYYKKAASLNPQNHAAKVGQASMGLELQKFEESLKIFEKICGISKPILASYRKAVSSLRAQKNNPEVKKWLMKFEVSLAKCEDF